MSLKDINEFEKHGNEYISTEKVQGFDHEEQPIVDKARYWSSIEQARKAFKEQGFNLDAINTDRQLSCEVRIHSNIGAEIFFTKVDISKGPIIQTVDVMHRQKAVEHYKDKDGREKQRTREFLTYGVRLEGVDWMGNVLKGSLEYEGRCQEPNRVVHINTDDQGKKKAQYVMGGLRDKFYIPFTKKAVDDILAKTDTDKDSVMYYGKFGTIARSGLTFRNGDFTYEQFVKPWEEFEALGKRDGGPSGKIVWKVLEDGTKKYIGD